MDLFASYETGVEGMGTSTNLVPTLDSRDMRDFASKQCNKGEFKDSKELKDWVYNFYREWHNVCESLYSKLNI